MTCVIDILVIGYGNELRGDDAIGPRVAEAVAAWQLPGVRALAVPQLTPELSEDIAAARQIAFVDATSEPSIHEVQVRALEPATVESADSHRSDPRALLALALALFGQAPPAWLMAIPVADFAYGAALSPLAQRGLAAALARLRELCAATAAPEWAHLVTVRERCVRRASLLLAQERTVYGAETFPDPAPQYSAAPCRSPDSAA